MTRAVVLGGGVAGLTAAFLLRERGFEVTLLESRGWLGGRAFSSRDRTMDAALDNGPHVMLGCYRAMRALLRRLGSEGEFHSEGALDVAYRLRDGAAARLRLWRLPVPLAMPIGLFALPLGFGGRLRALRGLLASLWSPRPGMTLSEWIARHGQGGPPADFFWVPLCRAVMNAEPASISAVLFLRTMREAFNGSAAKGAMWIPKRPWGEIVGEPAVVALGRAGITVRFGARVTGLLREGGAVHSVALGGGSAMPVGEGEVVVSALPWQRLRALLPDLEPPVAPGMAGSPLVSVYFALGPGTVPPADDGPLVALVDGDPFHFLFRTPGEDPRRFALLAGGADGLDGLGVEEIEQRARQQLAQHYPAFDPMAPAVVRVRKEAHATFLAAPGVLPFRPVPGRLAGGPANLMVCGDWTACGLPSTLEGAARSAEMAVDNWFRRRGN